MKRGFPVACLTTNDRRCAWTVCAWGWPELAGRRRLLAAAACIVVFLLGLASGAPGQTSGSAAAPPRSDPPATPVVPAASALAPPNAETHPQPRVLLICSYERAQTSTRLQEDAIRAEIERVYPFARVRSDYIVSAFSPTDNISDELLASIAQMLRVKHLGDHYDLIIAVDTIAFRALAGPGRDLIAGTPFVFTGVTLDRQAVDTLGLNATGVFERIDAAKTIELALQLHPDTERVVVISSGSHFAERLRAEAAPQLDAIKSRIPIEWSTATTRPGLIDELRSKGPHAIALYLAFTDQRTGVTDARGVQIDLPVPAYGAYQSHIRPSMIGGVLVSADGQGREAGRMAVRVLSGEKPTSIPPCVGCTNQPILRAPMLVRWGVPKSRVPEGVRIIEPIPGWSERLRPYWLWILAACILQAGIIALLLINRNRRIRTEDELRKQRERFELAIKGTNDGIWDWDILRDRIYWSDRLYESLGFVGENQITSLGLWAERLHPDDTGRTHERLESHLKHNAPYDVEYRMRLQDGSYRWFRARGGAIRDASGRPIRMAGSLADIHDRVSALERLSESEERYRQTFHTNQAIKLVIDPERGAIVDVNDAACAFYGYSREQLLGMSISEINTLPSELLRPKMEQALAGRVHYEFAHKLASGEVRDVEVYTGPFNFQGRRLLYSIVHDITLAKRARQALAESEAKHRRIVETAQEGIWMVDSAWKTTFVNARMASMLGYAPHEIMGRTVAEFLDDQGRAAFAIRAERRARGESEQYDLRFKRRDGSDLWALLSANSMVDDTGVFMGSLAMVTDITERRAAERMREGQHTVLEMIAGGAGLQKALDAVVRMVQEQDPACQGSIILLNPDGTVSTASAPDLPKAYAEGIDGLRIGPKSGSCGTAMYRRERVIVEDVLTSPLWEGYRDVAITHGFRACWSEPIMGSDGSVLGSLAMYHAAVRTPTRIELELIDSAAHLAGIAIERSRAADALAQSERRLALALTAGSMGAFEWDMISGRITWSEEHATLWGMSLRDFDGTYAAFARRVHPDDLPGIERAINEAMHAPPPYPSYAHEYRLVLPDGTHRWIEGRGQFVRDSVGRPIRMVGVVRDVTQRRQAEEALRASEATNRGLLEAVPDLIFRMDREGRYISYHAPDESLLAVPPEVFLGRTCREVLPKERSEQCMENLDRLFATGVSQTYEYEADRAGRKSAWEVRMVLPSPDEAMLLVRNITQAREAQRRLTQSEQRLSSMVRSTPLGVVVWNTDFTVAEWNPGAERIFGYTAQEAIGRHGRFIIAENARKYVDDVWRGLISNTGGFRGTNQNVRNDGVAIWCEWYNSPLVGADGLVFGVASLVEDITETRLAQQRQDLMMAELDHRVKNNLAAVISLAEQTGRSAHNFEEFVATFTGRVRAMSRMHSALARSRWQGADLLTLVSQTLEAFGSGSAGRTQLDGSSLMLDARAAQSMAMALNELATNAVKYGALSSAAGPEGCVHVSWRREQADNGDAPRLHLVWTETGGPAVAPPTRRGFGSELIEGAVAYELKGTVKLDFRPEGLICTMSVPLFAGDSAPLPENEGAHPKTS